MKKSENWKLWSVFILSAMAIWTFSSQQMHNPNNERFLNPPPEYIEHFHFGFRESLADSLWLRWIQDSDACQTYLAPVQRGVFYLGDDPQLTKNPRYKICDQSWGFKMLDAITKLAPLFWMAYAAGGPTLAVLIEDYEGATVIFERGLKYFPTDWALNYRAAYHFLFDKQDLPRAAALLVTAAQNGAPEWLRSLAGRLYEKSGQVDLGIATLEAYKATLTNEKSIKQIEERIRNLKAQRK